MTINEEPVVPHEKKKQNKTKQKKKKNSHISLRDSLRWEFFPRNDFLAPSPSPPSKKRKKSRIPNIRKSGQTHAKFSDLYLIIDFALFNPHHKFEPGNV